MDIKDAQKEMRQTYLHGFASFIISGTHWLIAAILATFISQKTAIIAIVFGGFFIFPLTKVLLAVMGIPNVVSKENPLNKLAIQSAFILPLLLPLVFIAGGVNSNWFLPALILIMGAHYLPFVTLYGSAFFGMIAGIFIGIGYFLIYNPINSFAIGGWIVSSVFYLLAGFIWVKAGHKFVRSLQSKTITG